MKQVITILGAGIAGLSSAYFAKKVGLNAAVYEASNSVGGLLDNFTIEGFRFDNAVHLSFATEKAVRDVFDQTEFNTLPADSLCFDQGYWLKHPVQNNLFPLPINDRVELIDSFVNRSEISPVKNYEDWLLHQYGEKIATRYPLKYTKKYWTVPAKALSTNWIGNRMRRAEFGEVLRGALTQETPNTYYTSEMRYPKKGGFKSFIKPLIESADVNLNKRVIDINASEKVISFSDGSEVLYSQLISSLPLPMIVGFIQDVPAEVKKAASELFATSVDLISIGFKGEIIKDLWFYIYDEDIFASRAYSPSVKSLDNVPKGCSSLQFEIYSSHHTDELKSESQLVENTLYALKKLKIASENDILFTQHKRVEYANVVFDHGMEARRDTVRKYLETIDILTVGRFGEWEYFWSNQAMMSGKNAIDAILTQNAT